jgi:tetratricopeptide (TPR) repeat protein
VQDRFLSRVTAQEEGSCATINVDFNVPVRYASHFPETGGRELRIRVTPLNSGGGSLSAGRSAENVRPPDSAIAGVQQISYDAADPAGPTLVLQFDHDAMWTVQADKNVSRIVVKVSRGAGCDPAGAVNASRASNIVMAVTRTVPLALDATGNYAINLASNKGTEVTPGSIIQLDAFNRFAAYAYSSEENGVTWARLRLGMFSTRADAEKVLQEVQAQYPDAWVARIDRSERERVYQSWLAVRAGATAQAPALAADPDADKLLTDLKAKLAAGDNPEAIRLAGIILGRPESTATPDAQELLGLARERNGQLAHAKAEYEIFLQKYPTSPAAPRVRQRLAALVGEPAQTTGQQTATKTPGSKQQAPVRWEASGSLSALYQIDESGFIFKDVPIVGGPEVNPDPIQQNQTNLNEMLYGADINMSLGNDRTEALFRFSGIYRDDFRTISPRDEGAVSALYFDFSDREWNSSLRLGRQTRNTGGVFGRFDGALGSVQFGDRIKVNAVSGFPVQSSRDLKVNTDRVLYGASVDYAAVLDHLDTTFYYLDQMYGGLIDRQAAGFEFRYFDASRTAYGIFDYDVHYGTMNLGLLNGTWRFKDESSVTLALDYRRSPLLTTQNAVFGQGVIDPNDLRSTYTKETIYKLATDRTAYARSASLSWSRPLMDKLQFNLDVIATNVSSTKASAGIEAQPATGTEYYYSGQLVASDVFQEGAIVIAGIRYADLQLSNQYTAQLNTRYPIMQDLRLNTKLRIDYRERKNGSSNETSARGSFALTYNWGRMTHFDFELGVQYTDAKNTLVLTTEKGLFGSLGLRRDF